jgi:hypothetical protein
MQDACIIDEQENHVVLTVRVPLDLIRDNHAMLMALSEIATGRPLPSLLRSQELTWGGPPLRRGALLFLGARVVGPVRPSERRNFFGAPLAIDDSNALDLSYKLLATIDLDLLVRRDGPDLFACNTYRSFKRRLGGAVLEILRLNRVGFDGGLGHDGQPSCSAPASDNQLRANSFRDRGIVFRPLLLRRCCFAVRLTLPVRNNAYYPLLLESLACLPNSFLVQRQQMRSCFAGPLLVRFGWGYLRDNPLPTTKAPAVAAEWRVSIIFTKAVG